MSGTGGCASARLDAAAAAILLQDYLDSHPATKSADVPSDLVSDEAARARRAPPVCGRRLVDGCTFASRVLTEDFAEPEVFVELPAGVGVQGIADRLVAAGVVPDPWTFRLAARLSNSERHLQAGEYRFADEASPSAIVLRLARGDVAKKTITFPEGLTIREMGAVFETAGFGPAADFVAAASDATPIADLDPDARTLEGFLFPDTYALSATCDGAEDRARDGRAFRPRFRRRRSGPRPVAAGLPLREVVTLASIVEKETGPADERPIIAAVYRNRLKPACRCNAIRRSSMR